MLTRLTEFGGGTKLSLVDRLTRTDVGGLPRLQTVGRELPGASRAGDYAVVSGPVAFVTGRVNGPAAMVTADGLPFVFETDGANGAFTLPVLADTPFVLRFSDAATGASLGSANGQGPQLGTTTDIGRPLAPVGSSLTASAQPDARSTVDVGAPIVFTFSAAVDRSSVTAGAFVVTDPAGVRVFGQVVVGDDGRTVTFVPSRRWRFGTLYRYGVSSNVVAASGARLSQPFAGEFTTFAPRVLGSVALGGVRDVAVSGNVGLAGTSAGVTVLDLTRPEAPAPTASLLLAGGAGGVAISTAPLVDRNGLAIPAPVAIVAAGDASSVGVVHTYGLATPASPTLLGSTQVTTPLGQTPPANVANVPGVPSAIVLNDAGRAFVATRSVGVTSIALGNAVPNNPADPGGAIAARFPATGTDSASHAALLGSNVLVAGAAGLTILDRSLQRLGSASTTGEARGVAALPAAQMDLNGDGTIRVETEQFDVAIVANGADGTVQIFRVTNPAAPELVSVVRVPGAVEGVAVNAGDRLAYVGVGARGVALIDLSGAQGIQPIDFDRDGLDDRVLGFVDTPGSAGRLTLNLARGLGYVADGSNLSVVQLLPARTRFETLMRDVVGGVTGDEESILASREAFTSDAAILVTIHAAIPPRTDLFLRLDELTEGAALTSFPDGSASVRLVDGVNTLTIPIAGNASSTGGQVRLLVTTGATDIASLVIRLTPPPVAGSAIQSMFITPQRLDLNDAARSGQLGVGGVLNNGRIVNLTSSSTGTTYRSADDRIASVDAGGLVTAVAGGRVDIVVTNGEQTALAAVRVDAPGAVAALETPRPRVTLTSVGQTQALQLEAIFTDGLSVRTLRGLVTFSTSNAAVVTVDAEGVLTAVGPGTAIITARVGDLVQQFTLTVEPRAQANLTGLIPFRILIIELKLLF